MKNTNRMIAAVAGCLVLITAGSLAAQDWPQWRGPNRDGKLASFTAPDKWPASLTLKWKKTVGAGDATPALVGDRLYLFTRQGDEEVTLCLNASDGGQIWRDKYAAQAVTGAAARHPGPRSSPAVGDGKVVNLGVGGVLSCLDASSGNLLWRKDPFPKVVPQFFTSCSPIIADGLAIAQLGGRGNGAIMAYELANGNEKWRWDAEGPEYASPVLLTVAGDKQIVTLTEQSIVAVGLADGKLRWKRPFAPARRAYNAATPIVDGQTVIYTGAGRGTIAVKIEKQADGFAAKELWSNPDLAPQFNTPVLKEGLLFGLSNRGSLYCINAETGQTAWTDPTGRDRSGFAGIVDAGPCLFALPSSAEMLVFKPDPKQYVEIAKYKLADASAYAHPVVAGKRIFVKDQDSLSLWVIQ
ncbi:MAG: PQQ-like beta-propeller repeat protein [Phycisphaerales bacterium]|nr:MAG: PQQ-like beta-propeller repeat protein [Phycisphaerales bacterium]